MIRNRTDLALRLTDALSHNTPDLLRYLERRLNRDDAADALADLMTIGWRRANTLPAAPEQARMWLFGIARHVVANAARTERRQSNLAERLRETLRTTPAEVRSIDEDAEVRDAIARLAPDQAELVRLIHWEGFSIAEAGKILGISASTARTRYQRARADLKAALSLHGDTQIYARDNPRAIVAAAQSEQR